MKSCGIVAEYNPFHNGHKYQVEQVRRAMKPDVVIAVMSGNFLQRGEPALIDKWTRTKMALAGGVDLVIELPAVFAVQPADYFAKGAIQIMDELAVGAISFGVENGTAAEFLAGAKWMVENDECLTEVIKSDKYSSVPYAKQVEESIKELAPDFPLHLNSPNNQLAFAYTKEVVKQGLEQQIELLPLQRYQAAYNEEQLNEESTIASATAIRKTLQQSQSVQSYIPEASYPYLDTASKQYVSWDDYYHLLKYQMTIQSEEKLRKIYQMTEGLENRLKSSLREQHHFTRFMNELKTKRYTQTRLQRLLTYVLLQWENEAVLNALDEKPALRVLGFSKMGREYLSYIKRDLSVPLLANVNQSTKKWIPFDISAGEIYRLGREEVISEQDFTQKPVKID